MIALRALAALLLVASMTACAAPAAHRAAGDSGLADFRLDAFRWRAGATPQLRIVARNDYGDLRVRTAQRGGLVVSAMVQKIGWTIDELEIRVVEGDDVVRVDVVPKVRAPRGRVDLTLIVPAGKSLQARTRDGIAEIKYRGASIDLATRDGDVTLDAAGPARIRTRDGDVRARLTGTDATQRSALSTRAGDIELHVATRAGEPAAAIGQRVRATSRRGTVRVLPYAG